MTESGEMDTTVPAASRPEARRRVGADSFEGPADDYLMQKPSSQVPEVHSSPEEQGMVQ